MSRREMTDGEIELVDKLCKEYELFKAETLFLGELLGGAS